MLMNRKELLTWLINKGRIEEETYISIDRHVNRDALYTPMKYEGIYECIGKYTVWDEVGGVASDGRVYKPCKGGTLVFEV